MIKLVKIKGVDKYAIRRGIIFWPIMIILLVVGLSRKHYIIAVGKEMEKYEMTEEQFRFYKAYKECYDDFNTSEEEV